MRRKEQAKARTNRGMPGCMILNRNMVKDNKARVVVKEVMHSYA